MLVRRLVLWCNHQNGDHILSYNLKNKKKNSKNLVADDLIVLFNFFYQQKITNSGGEIGLHTEFLLSKNKKLKTKKN